MARKLASSCLVSHNMSFKEGIIVNPASLENTVF